MWMFVFVGVVVCMLGIFGAFWNLSSWEERVDLRGDKVEKEKVHGFVARIRLFTLYFVGFGHAIVGWNVFKNPLRAAVIGFMCGFAVWLVCVMGGMFAARQWPLGQKERRFRS